MSQAKGTRPDHFKTASIESGFNNRIAVLQNHLGQHGFFPITHYTQIKLHLLVFAQVPVHASVTRLFGTDVLGSTTTSVRLQIESMLIPFPFITLQQQKNIVHIRWLSSSLGLAFIIPDKIEIFFIFYS